MHLTTIVAFVILVTSANLGHSKPWDFEDLDFAESAVKEFEKGGGKEHEAEQHSSHGEKGEKGYSGHHGEAEGKKGHHDKEGHKGHYEENGGNKKSHHHDDGYYASHHKGEKGKKGHHYEEHGSFAKGHSTKGAHSIHKLDEFKKDTEFFDEDHDEAHKEKHGGYEHAAGFKKRGHEKGGHAKKVFLEADFGRKGGFENGAHYDQDAGYKKAAGHDSHNAHSEEKGAKGGQEGYKKWSSSH